MKKFNLLLPISFLFLPFIVECQVAKITTTEINKERIVLIGPLNVDSYFPGQADSYILQYQEMIRVSDKYMAKLELELAALEEKTIRNGNRINQKQVELDKTILNLELLEHFVAQWQEHDEVFKIFNEDLVQIDDTSICYHFIIKNDTFSKKDIEIVEMKKGEKVEYYEIIDGEYSEVLYAIFIEEEDWELIKRDGKIVNDIPSTSTIRNSNLLTDIENFRHTTVYENIKLKDKYLEIDDPQLISSIEGSFPSFNFDGENLELFRGIEMELDEDFYQIILKNTNKQLLPESWFLEVCE